MEKFFLALPRLLLVAPECEEQGNAVDKLAAAAKKNAALRQRFLAFGRADWDALWPQDIGDEVLVGAGGAAAPKLNSAERRRAAAMVRAVSRGALGRAKAMLSDSGIAPPTSENVTKTENLLRPSGAVRQQPLNWQP